MHVEALGGRHIELWAAVTPGAAPARRRIGIVGTGNPSTIDASIGFVGTVIAFRSPGGPRLVWHLFDLGEH